MFWLDFLRRLLDLFMLKLMEEQVKSIIIHSKY